MLLLYKVKFGVKNYKNVKFFDNVKKIDYKVAKLNRIYHYIFSMTFTLYIKISVNMQNYWALEFLRDMGYPLVQNFSVLLFKKNYQRLFGHR